MIQILAVSVDAFRSIIEPIGPLEFEAYTVLTGPNNSGKSNVLRALELFFNGTVEGARYSAARDFPKADLHSSKRTSVTVLFRFDPVRELQLERAVSELEKDSAQRRLAPNEIRLRLIVSRSGEEIWRFLGTKGAQPVRAELADAVGSAMRDRVKYKYLPVGRDTTSLVSEELASELLSAIFSGFGGAVKFRQEINGTISTLLDQLKPPLDASGSIVADGLGAVFSEVSSFDLKLPFEDLESLIPSLIPTLGDQYDTELRGKGAGIQTSSLLFLLKYLADKHPKRRYSYPTWIWAIEEPESYLHPSRQRAMSKVLQEFSGDVQTIVTTHSAHFVPRDSCIRVFLVDKSDSSPFSTTLAKGTFEEARLALGVSLLDAMYLYPVNLIVEGVSDEILLKAAWGHGYASGELTIPPWEVRFFPGGGAGGATYTYESLVGYGDGDEVFIGLILDGDQAGHKALHGLNKRAPEPLKSNTNYFILDKETEWLLPVDAMLALAKERPTQVVLVENTEGNIANFGFDAGSKVKVALRAAALCTELDDWGDMVTLLAKIEQAVQR